MYFPMPTNVDSKAVDDLMQEGIDEKKREDSEATEKQIHISFLAKSIEARVVAMERQQAK